ncbi:MAG: T9SS type A sorting domain-containing protein [Hyphomicrobiales bacterium]
MKTLFSILACILFPSLLFAQWPKQADMVNMITDDQYDQTDPIPYFLSDGSMLITYYSHEVVDQDARNFNLRIQKLDPNGNRLWGDAGMLISKFKQDDFVYIYNFKLDYEENAIIAVSDIREGSEDVHLYKISPEGEFLWGKNGISFVDTHRDNIGTTIAILQDNSVIISYASIAFENESDIVSNRISKEGEKLWGEGIKIKDEGIDYINPKIITATDNTVILTYLKQQESAIEIYSQKYDTEGEEVWENPVLISDSFGIPIYFFLNAISDQDGGVFIAYTDDRDMDNILNVNFHHILSDGTSKWPKNGAIIANTPTFYQSDPQIAGITSDGNLIGTCVQKDITQSSGNFIAQSFDDEGNLLWGDEGFQPLNIDKQFGTIINSTSVNDTNIIVYTIDSPNSVLESNIKGTAFGKNKEILWDQLEQDIASNYSRIVDPHISPIWKSKFVVVWDNENNVFGQLVNSNGKIGLITSLHEIYTNILNIYPNPVISTLTIEGIQGECNYYIQSMTGQVIHEGICNNGEQINLPALSSGVYIIKIKQNNNQHFKKKIILY